MEGQRGKDGEICLVGCFENQRACEKSLIAVGD